MVRRKPSLIAFWLVQVFFAATFGAAFGLAPPRAAAELRRAVTHLDVFQRVAIPRRTPLVVPPLYDRPDLVSDEDLAAVLRQVQPRFPREKLKPNFVEHALRVWGVRAKFADPAVLSGAELADFLTDHARYSTSWGREVQPLLDERPGGIAIRYGKEAGQGASVHHDHWLASLTEAGVNIETPVFGPGRHNATIQDVLQESLRDFRLDERETEWTAMAFGLWLPPTREWTGSEGRHYSFDLLASRLMRGELQLGVCSGTHRVYSLMLLVRLDDEFDILSDKSREAVWQHLEGVRDAIAVSQFEDGHWPSNWPDAAAAVADPIEEELYKQVIATGHHLEWLSIAPLDLHPPEDHIRRAVRWLIDTTVAQTPEEIYERYTYFSHVGNALAQWRRVRPAEFWAMWEGRAK